MSKALRLTAFKVIQILKTNGFVEVSQTGSHLKMFNAFLRRTVIIPVHKGKTLPIGTLKAIEKQSGIKFL